MNPRYALVAARAEHRCEYCHAPEAIFNFKFEVEHVVPPGQVGSDTEDNWGLERDAQNGWRELGGAGILGELAKGVRRA